MVPDWCLIIKKPTQQLDILKGETKRFASSLNFKQSGFNQGNCYGYANST